MSDRCGAVLIVEDDPDVRELLVRRFRRAGHRTVAVDSGEAALVAVLSERPDLAVVDIMLPGMDGWDFIRHLRAQAFTDTVPVYVLSVLDPADSAELPTVDGYVMKPFRSADIARLVHVIESRGN
ncbi:MAG: response regulator [Sporichthyaceae bacterium]